jgi:hypothetical protein
MNWLITISGLGQAGPVHCTQLCRIRRLADHSGDHIGYSKRGAQAVSMGLFHSDIGFRFNRCGWLK